MHNVHTVAVYSIEPSVMRLLCMKNLPQAYSATPSSDALL